MLAPLLLLQLAAGSPRAAPNYATPSLAVFIAAAADSNRRPPPSLRGYVGRVESELSLILRDTLGREHVAQVEQVAMEARWRRDIDYDLHIVGYRSASVGVPYSALSLVRSWTVPVLYGDRLSLGVDVVRGGPGRRDVTAPDSERVDSTRPGARAAVPPVAVHPLATDRDRFYRFTGGDTIAVIRSHGRTVPIARVRIVPVLDSAPRDTTISLFDGEIEFDASRHQIVRMRGRIVTRIVPRRKLRSALTHLPGLVAVAFIEFVNAEVDGRYWLPSLQRTEFQATFAPLGSQRSVFRLLSRFSDLSVMTAPVATNYLADSIGSAPLPGALHQRSSVRQTLSYANNDSVSRYDRWLLPLGSATSDVSASDFDEFLPDPWRPNGRPRLEFAPTKPDDIFRYDRVEGAFSGAAIGLRFRDAAPGLAARAYGGWAWSEQTLRGGATVGFTRGGRTVTGRVERALVSTNDFAAPLDVGTIGFAGLLGADDQDYLDRRTASLTLTSAFGSVRNALATGEIGLGRDREEIARMASSPFSAAPFRINRGSTDGGYVRGGATVELHPDVTGLFLEPGAGLVTTYEIGRGQLRWQRSEVTVAVRHSLNDFVIAGRAQAGWLLGRDLPPQELFELGGEGALPGYAYKQFAGDRAAVAGLLASYPLPLLRRPMHLVRSLVVPGLSPGVAAGVQSGWAEASSPSVLASIRRLDPLAPANCIEQPTISCPAPLSTPTHGARATVDARLTMFGGLLGVGVARAVDQSARWRLVFRFGQEY